LKIYEFLRILKRQRIPKKQLNVICYGRRSTIRHDLRSESDGC